MINSFILEGKIIDLGNLAETSCKEKHFIIEVETLSGENDFIQLEVGNSLAKMIYENVKIGDVVSAQGKIQGHKTNNNIEYKFNVEKFSFLA